MPNTLTDAQIEQMARDMEQVGAPSWKIERFIETARKEQRDSDAALSSVVVSDPETSGQAALKTAKDVSAKTASLALDIGLEGAGAAVGQGLSVAMGRPGMRAAPVLRGAGAAGGNLIAQIRRDRPLDIGEIGGAFVGGMVGPTNTVRNGIAGTRALGEEMFRSAASNYAATLAQTAINEKRPPTIVEAGISSFAGMAGAKFQHMASSGKSAAKEAESLVDRAIRRETYKEAISKGYILDPGLSNPNAVNSIGERISGSSQIQRAAAKENQAITNRLAREDIKYPSDWKLDAIHLDEHIRNLSEPYEQIRQTGPMGELLVNKLKHAKNDETATWRAFNAFDRPANSEKLEKAAKAASARVESLETALDKYLQKIGNSGLYEEFQKARVLIGKANVVKAALDAGGNVSAPSIGSMWDKSKRNLTGNLELIARLDGTMPQVMREGATVQPVGPGSWRPFLAAAAAKGAYDAAGGSVLAGLAGAGAVAYGHIPVQAAMLSPFYQKNMAVPPALQRMSPETFATMLRYAGSSLGRPKQEPAPQPAPAPHKFEPAVEVGELDSPKKASKAEDAPKRLSSFKIGKRYRDPDTREVRVYLGDGQFALA